MEVPSPADLEAAGLYDPRGDDIIGLSSVVQLRPGRERLTMALLGENVVLQLARVLGVAMGRIADAVISAFLVNVGAQAMADDPVKAAEPSGVVVSAEVRCGVKERSGPYRFTPVEAVTLKGFDEDVQLHRVERR